MKEKLVCLCLFLFIGSVPIIGICFAEADVNSEDDSDIVNESRDIRWRLRKAGVLSMPERETKQSKVSLEELIEKLQLFGSSLDEQQASEELDAAVGAQEVTVKNDVQPVKDKVVLQITEKLAQKTVPDIAEMIGKPEDTLNPMAVAESFYKDDKLEAARKYYEETLDRIEGRDNPNIPWILFQTANSLRNDQPQEAYKTYENLIVEYPNSHWSHFARAQQKIIAWEVENKPKAALERYNVDPNSF